ncbi:ABC transporter ATP-binding protein [Cellulomonas sp. PhB150]|uniref:ABC transporter ATP-binding protein n=1 Tax=Cellulomonas sp. PhB150 TaxID=2485188 RepID=UPI000F4A0C6F|nr:ABC transporter ATP-binding protein [Cellulomonas sp. PhB150]ROS31014.1 ABC-2 type transport system ATP-binding protein [Cellulomonas sp. PhB150]
MTTELLDTPTTGTLALDLRGLRKSFGTVRAVDGLDLAVRPGEVVAFLGPNGAGKTTTIDMLLGLAEPDEGTVQVLGLEPSAAIAAGRVSAVMQSGGLLKDLTVAETIELTASFFRGTRSPREVMERAGIAEIADRRVGKCSGGQQQRLRFALALLPDPDVIVLDEPTTGMDVEGRRDFWNALRADAARGRTIIFATHYLEEADAYADRIVLVSHGRIVADGSAAQVKSLTAGRTVSASFEGALDEAALRALPGVQDVEVRRERVIIRTTDSDAVARHLLTATDATDLEIAARGLEDAFLALTTDHAATHESIGSIA